MAEGTRHATSLRLVRFAQASQTWLSITPKEGTVCKRGAHSDSDKCVTLSRVVIWSSLIHPAMDCVRDERIIGESDRSSAHWHPKSKMGTVSHRVAGCAKCVSECDFDCRNVRVYCGGPGARPDFR